MNVIASADNHWGIGKDNELLVRIPEDMKRFRAFTIGNVVVMGRKTLESFPKQAPLKDRVNIVMTTRQDYRPEGVVLVHSTEELKEELKKYDSRDVYVIGGDSIYRQLLDWCDTAHITKIQGSYEADAYFPNLEEHPDWNLVEESQPQTHEDVIYTYQTYKRV